MCLRCLTDTYECKWQEEGSECGVQTISTVARLASGENYWIVIVRGPNERGKTSNRAKGSACPGRIRWIRES
jgi:hypothetical protein